MRAATHTFKGKRYQRVPQLQKDQEKFPQRIRISEVETNSANLYLITQAWTLNIKKHKIKISEQEHQSVNERESVVSNTDKTPQTTPNLYKVIR